MGELILMLIAMCIGYYFGKRDERKENELRIKIAKEVMRNGK